MATHATFRARGAHRALGSVKLEVEGGLLGIHHATPGRQGSIYWPRTACAWRAATKEHGPALQVAASGQSHTYELEPDDFQTARSLRESLGEMQEVPPGARPRRPVTMEHEWPFAEPWNSIRQVTRNLARPRWAAFLLLPLIAPYAWLRLRREAARHAPEAIEGFRLFAAGEFGPAQGQLRAALEAQPGDYDAFYLLLHACVRRFDFAGALACAAEHGMEAKVRASHLDNDIRLLAAWREGRHDPLLYRETKDREGIGLIGRRGEAITMLRPAGKVCVEGAEYSGRTEGEFASSGQPVEVIGWDGVSLIVRSLDIE